MFSFPEDIFSVPEIRNDVSEERFLVPEIREWFSEGMFFRDGSRWEEV